MPHVDEGLLHAYLDGALDALREAGALPHGTTRDSIDAHLAVCADCRALLEAERAIRTRAGAVLDAAAPIVDVPPFSELFPASRARPRRRAWPLAWVASVLLAVGAGWWGSELVRRSEQVSSVDMAEPSREADRALVEAPQRDGGAGAGLPAPSATAPAEPAAAATDAVMQDAPAGFAATAGARREVARADDETRARDLAAVQERERTEAARIARGEAAGRAALPDSDTVLGRPVGAVADSARVALLAGRAAAVAPPAPAAAPPPPMAQSAISQFLANEPGQQARIDEFRRTLADFEAGRVRLDTGALPPDLLLLKIDGGSVPEVQRGGVLGATFARITQQAPNGVAVELIVWKQTALALDQLVVTGRAAPDTAADRALRQRAEAQRAQSERAELRRAESMAGNVRQKANAAPIVHTVVSSSTVLADGRRELLLRPVDGDVLVALRARVSAAELQALAGRLVELRRD